jgi:hypothetical protein
LVPAPPPTRSNTSASTRSAGPCSTTPSTGRSARSSPRTRRPRFRAFFADLRPGLTHFLCHPAKGGEELDAIVPETCRHRAKEYDLFRGPEFRTYCESLGIKLTGYREIRDRLRASISTRA